MTSLNFKYRARNGPRSEVALVSADFLESVKDVDSVANKFGHGHVVGGEDSFHFVFLLEAEAVQLAVGLANDLILGNLVVALEQPFVGLYEFLEDGFVVEDSVRGSRHFINYYTKYFTRVIYASLLPPAPGGPVGPPVLIR